ncbi:MAG: ATP synthase F0 subunit B [Lachnospiraceae bacterium]|nr:ATP synthase F0 subunit B [Lachnospiraceae bacterium]
MPLNIDIQQIFLHLFNFAILLAGLYFPLYKPVRKFMDKRTDYYRQMDEEAKERLAQAEELKSSYAKQLDGVDDEIRSERAKAAARIEEQTSGQIEDAKVQAEKILAEARENAELERQKIVASARQEIVDLAAQTAQQIIRQSLETAEGSECDEG